MQILSVKEAKKLIDPTKKIVFISGVTGQDGSLLSDYILETTDYTVIGGIRRLSVHNHININHLKENPRFIPVNFDLTDSHSIDNLVMRLKPNYFINLAAQSFVKSSWEFPQQTLDVNVAGVIHCLEAIQKHAPTCRFYNAGSSEEQGEIIYTPQDENHPLNPQSPYGASKCSARFYVRVYRKSYNLFAIQPWLFNHEGPRRGKEFVTRKITRKVAEIFKHLESKTFEPIDPLELGNLDACRDWSDAEDMVRAIWLMINAETPKEYVVSSGVSHSIREFVEEAFKYVGIKGQWEGTGVDEIFKYVSGPVPAHLIEGTLVRVNPAFYRPAEVETLCGNSSKIRKELGWKPTVSFHQLVEKMMRHELEN